MPKTINITELFERARRIWPTRYLSLDTETSKHPGKGATTRFSLYVGNADDWSELSQPLIDRTLEEIEGFIAAHERNGSEAEPATIEVTL